MAIAATTTCAHCGERFNRGRRQNQYHRATERRHTGGRYCSDRCRKRASRARNASVTEVRPEPPGTTPHASVTGALRSIDITGEFSTKNTDLGPLFQRHSVPLNLIGGYRFAGAPELAPDLVRAIRRTELGDKGKRR